MERKTKRKRRPKAPPRNCTEASRRQMADWTPTTAVKATSSLPGSDQRIATYGERIERGEELWHEADSDDTVQHGGEWMVDDETIWRAELIRLQALAAGSTWID